MLVYDSNLFYRAGERCRDRKCEEARKAAIKALKRGERVGCTITPTVEREVRKHLIEEYDDFCNRLKLNSKQEKFVKKFVDKLTVFAYKDNSLFRTCTSQAEDVHSRISKAQHGDWKLVAESFLSGDDVTVVSFDRNLTNPMCQRVYRQTAKIVAEGEGVKVANRWRAVKPYEVIE